MTSKNLDVNEDLIEQTIKQVETNLAVNTKKNCQITLEDFLNASVKNQALQNLMNPKIV
jgi:hypothetical protein